MGKPIIDDELWALIELLLPPAKPQRFRYPGRKPVSDRAALTGILFVLGSGIRWNDYPATWAGISCWRRLRDWQSAGVWARLHEVLLARLCAADRIAFLRVIDFPSVRAVWADQKTETNPTEHARPGSKHHVATDAKGTPIAVILTAANRNDILQLLPLIEAIHAVRV